MTFVLSTNIPRIYSVLGSNTVLSVNARLPRVCVLHAGTGFVTRVSNIFTRAVHYGIISICLFIGPRKGGIVLRYVVLE